MACIKCGSDWVTLKGKDMVSCPECCKQQRCKARKQGRLPAEESKRCERCGCEFTASGGNAIRQARYCLACSEVSRREYLQSRKDKIKSGEWQPKPQAKIKCRKCLRCGKKLSENQIKYCGRECFNAAKKEGFQSWDRTRQLESIWHRGGRWACAPSRKPIQEMRHNMHAFLRNVASVYSQALKKMPLCLNCGTQCQRDSSEFCSSDCWARYRELLPCSKCGVQTLSMRRRPQACENCQKQMRRDESRRSKRLYVRNHRTRARHHGVRYVSVPVKRIYERDNYTCQICSRKCLSKAKFHKATRAIHPRSPSIDHIIPMCRGGDHVESNLQTACWQCNTLKGSKGGGQLRLAIAQP